MRIRIALGAVIATVALLSPAASASACATASLTLPPSAGPGDTVWFSISSIEPGATYTITLDGHEVASGTNDTSYNGVSGSFTMPDLGDQPTMATGFALSNHAADNDTQDPSRSMSYQPRVAPAAASPAPSAPPSSSVSAEKARRTHHAQRPIAVAKHAAKRQRQDPPTTGAAAGAAPSTSVGSEPGPSDPSSGSGSVKDSKAESSSVPHQVFGALGSTTSVGPAKVPTLGLLLMTLIFIAGTALAGLVIYLSQTGPDPKAAIKSPAPLGHDPVEVELQEMIGNEMARQLLSDLELGEQLPSGPA